MKIKLSLSTFLVIILMASVNIVFAEENILEALITPFRQKDIVPVNNKQYIDECSACHFAYQPGLLPAKSWEKLLTPAALSKHFGENAELDKDTLTIVYNYAIANSADKSFHKRSRKIAQATSNNEAPLRITEVRYIKRKHHEIPEKMIQGNKEVKSLSYCDACHTHATKGVYDADTVRIPNYPDWDE
jgi:hypothetical protein